LAVAYTSRSRFVDNEMSFTPESIVVAIL